MCFLSCVGKKKHLPGNFAVGWKRKMNLSHYWVFFVVKVFKKVFSYQTKRRTTQKAKEKQSGWISFSHL